MSDFSDNHIISIARTNKQRAVTIAFDQYWELLFRHAYGKLQSEDLAKDAVQEVFIVMWENLDKLLLLDNLLPYLYSVLRHRILTQFRKDEVRLRYALAQASKEAQFEPSTHQLLLNKELQEIIKEEVDKMPEKMQQIYILKKEENCSIKEIAEQLSLSEQTVKNQLFNASTRLKQRLINYDPSLLQIGLIISGIYLAAK